MKVEFSVPSPKNLGKHIGSGISTGVRAITSLPGKGMGKVKHHVAKQVADVMKDAMSMMISGDDISK